MTNFEKDVLQLIDSLGYHNKFSMNILTKYIANHKDIEYIIDNYSSVFSLHKLNIYWGNEILNSFNNSKACIKLIEKQKPHIKRNYQFIYNLMLLDNYDNTKDKLEQFTKLSYDPIYFIDKPSNILLNFANQLNNEKSIIKTYIAAMIYVSFVESIKNNKKIDIFKNIDGKKYSKIDKEHIDILENKYGSYISNKFIEYGFSQKRLDKKLIKYLQNNLFNDFRFLKRDIELGGSIRNNMKTVISFYKEYQKYMETYEKTISDIYGDKIVYNYIKMYKNKKIDNINPINWVLKELSNYNILSNYINKSIKRVVNKKDKELIIETSSPQ